MSASATRSTWTPSATVLPRLVSSPPATTLAAHARRFGPRPDASDMALVEEVGRAGLRGRGGAGFPAAVKLEAVRSRRSQRSLLARRRGAVVVANGTEGEPASNKDAVLLAFAPHLVIDGAIAAAQAVGADRVLLCVDRLSVAVIDAVQRAIAELDASATGDVSVELVATPSRYVAGEESALVHFLNGGDAKPTLVPPRPFERGVGGNPTLVSNVETLGQIALIARFGAEWWRSVGTDADPGSALFSLSGAVDLPGVYELPLGVELGAVLRHAAARPASGVLIGGYFGTWLTPETAATIRLGAADLAGVGASMGCGAIAVLPATACPLAEVARVTRWLADQSAGQCGPCVFGLPSIADALDAVVAGDRGGRAEAALRRWLAMVHGRGACKLPDGVNRFVSSALEVFGTHLVDHRAGGPCHREATALLPVPQRQGGWR